MTRKSPENPEDTPDETVPSYLAEPSRPGGEAGVHQPVQPSAPVPPPQEPQSDAELERLVGAVLTSDGRLSSCAITVKSAGGVVDLNGSVPLEYQRTLATALANSVHGVLVVQNRLDVRET